MKTFTEIQQGAELASKSWRVDELVVFGLISELAAACEAQRLQIVALQTRLMAVEAKNGAVSS